MNMVPLGEFMPSRIPSVNPAKHPEETFELWSIPAFDAGKPDVVLGSKIGSSKKCVEPGDVLLSRIVPHIRRSWIVAPNSENRQIASGEWITFRSDAFDAGYMRHILISDPFHAEFMQTVAGVGGSLLRARPDGDKQIEIPLPALEEQRRIAGILDQEDALSRLCTGALDKLNTLGQAIFHEMFGDPAVEPDRWPSKPLTEFVANKDDIRCGPFGTQLHKSEFQTSGVPLWGIKQVNKHFDIETEEFVSEQKFNDLRVYSLEPGDIVMTRKGTIGNCAVYPNDFPVGIMHSDLLRLRIDRERHNPTFMSAQLRFNRTFSYQLKLISGGAIMAGINVSRLKLLEAIAPPKGLQDQYEKQLTALERNRQNLINAVNAQSGLFASLQHRAFRGEL